MTPALPGCFLLDLQVHELNNFYAYTTPSFTINRAYFPGEAHIAYDMNDYLLAFDSLMLQALISDMVTQDLTSPCFAGLTLTNSYDATEPTRLSATLVVTFLLSSLESITAAEPVNALFLAVPNATTITSSRVWLSGSCVSQPSAR